MLEKIKISPLFSTYKDAKDVSHEEIVNKINEIVKYINESDL
jgi:hypothetical protein